MLQAVQLNTTKTFAKAKAAPSKRAMKANRRQAMTATALGGVAVALAALSLNDLASGIALVSPNVSTWQAWALAIGIDAGFITTELVQLTISEKLRKAIAPLQPRPHRRHDGWQCRDERLCLRPWRDWLASLCGRFRGHGHSRFDFRRDQDRNHGVD
jgi:hypothetical protein